MTITLNNPLLVLCLFYFALSSFVFYLFKRANLFFKVIVFSAVISIFIVVEQVNRIEVTLSALLGFFIVYRESIFEFIAGVKYFSENLIFATSSFFGGVFKIFAWLFKLLAKLSLPPQEEQAEQPQRTNHHQNRENRRSQSQQQERQRQAEQERIRQAKEDLKRQREKARQEQDNRSPEQILGLQDGFTLSDLKKAYKLAVSRYHPDKYAHMSEVFQKESEAELVKVQQAYNELLKKAK